MGAASLGVVSGLRKPRVVGRGASPARNKWCGHFIGCFGRKMRKSFVPCFHQVCVVVVVFVVIVVRSYLCVCKYVFVLYVYVCVYVICVCMCICVACVCVCVW